ncbi:carboxypeptidase M32 [Ferrimonas futtsuensis]|uniref:carboxypeptidase M32 n=1 Tax=Ferrimonas futtsuensis TaxID=364764 RepID=UPI000480A0FF|nr:carboxypeptidase M32 [Ferrimonas futtsuensis]
MTQSSSDLTQLFTGICRLEHALALMEWDQATLCSEAGQAARGEAMAELHSEIHRRLNQSWVAEALAQAPSDTAEQRRMLTLMSRRHKEATLLDEAFVRRKVTLSVACETAWRRAREENHFSYFADAFTPLLTLLKEEGVRRAEPGEPLYQALLKKFEPDLSLDGLNALFAPVEAQLPELIQQASARSAQRTAEPLPRIGVEEQKRVAERLAHQLGFDPDAGRIDVSTHPFTAGVPGDIRITSRYDRDNLLSGFYSMIHEVGHARFEQGIDSRWHQTPMARVQSAGLHEAQALAFEMQLAREPEFLKWLSQRLQQEWGSHAGLSAANLQAHVHRVTPSLIRVEADEVTYPAHILLRLRLEQALLSGDLPLNDLPDAWNRGMEQLLGVTPSNDREGCLQDIHWCFAEFGYFPSYALGAMLAAQQFEGLRQQTGWQQPVPERHLWVCDQLSQTIWHRGGSQDLNQAALDISGSPLSAEPLLTHLRRRYLED